MGNNPEERRSYPRVKTSLKVNINKNIYSESIDLSEKGVSFNFKETISSPKISLQISFPDSGFKFKTKAKLVWQKNLLESGSLYGLEFIGIKEAQKTSLRKELIKAQISRILSQINDRQIKEQVRRFFLKDMLHYVTELVKLTDIVSKKSYYSKEIEDKFEHLTTEILLKGYCLEELVESKKIISSVKESFRLLVGAWVYKGPIVKRSFEKPRGYPGDYLMLEAIYNNQPLAKEGIGFYADTYFLKSPYAVAVRYRKDKLRQILEKEIQKAPLGIMRIFDVACGSCREIKELSLNLFQSKKVIFTCLDWDEEALEFSQKAINFFPPNAKLNFVKHDIIALIKNTNLPNTFEKQDLIYSIGLIDYLPDRVLKLFMQFFYGLLKEKGKLILTHKNKEKTFSPVPPNWVCDWKFVPRSKDEVINLFYNCRIKDFSLLTETDEFNDIFYFTIHKLKG